MAAIRIHLPSQPGTWRVRGLGKFLAMLIHEVKRGFFDPYRPERHYMRGPGPKWRERHETAG